MLPGRQTYDQSLTSNWLLACCGESVTKQTKTIRALLPLLKLYPWAIPVIVTLGILSSLSEGLGISLFIPFLQSLDQTASSAASSRLTELLNQILTAIPHAEGRFVIPLLILASILLKNCLAYSNRMLSYWLNMQISHRLRSGIFKQLLSVSYSFLDAHQSGQLLNTLNTETWQTSYALSTLVGLVITACTIAVFTILLLLISWQLTFLVAIAMVLISITIQFLTREVRSLGQQAVQANATLTNQMLEGLIGMKVIRAFSHEPYEQQRFDRSSEAVRRTFTKLELVSGAVGPLSEVLAAVMLVCILVIGLQDRDTLPTLLTFIFILYRLQPQVKQFDSARVGLLAVTASVKDVLSLLDRSDKPYIHSGTIPFQGLKHEIAFKAVTFSYHSGEKPALQNISLSIPRSQTTALVGPSGAGKSTLINLICRFYDPTQGEILIDGLPLAQLQLVAWRRQIAIVSQDIHMFSTTVRENIAYGQLEATESEIIAAASLANADEFIRQLPQGYETKVGDRGIRLSGGQRQRIALARAIIRNAELLILDEATNALDSVSETLIQEAINTFSQNRTVIVIAHRLSTIEKADQIIVLDQGKVVEQGSLQHLLQCDGLFARLYSLQFRDAY